MDLFKILGTIAINNKEANDALDETADKGEDAEGKLVTAFKNIGGAIATYFAVDKIVDFGYNLATTAAEVSAEASAFEQIMGDYSDEAAGKVGAIADEVGAVDTRLTPYMTSMTAKFKGLGYEVDEATDFAARGLTLAADASAFWDKSLDDSMSALNSFINGSYEGGEAIGIFANDTQMAAYAVETGLISQTKDWANLEESIKQATRLEYAENMMAASGATGQAAKEAGQYANVQANLTEKWRQFKADIGEPILQNIVIPAMDKLSGAVDVLSDSFQKASDWCAEHKDEVQALAIMLGTLATAIGVYNIVQNASAIATAVATVATTAFGAAVNFATSPITLIILAIGALVAGFLYLWNNCEGFREFWINLWENIKVGAKAVADWFVAAWEAIGDFFTTTVPGWFSAFKDFFVGIWESIKSAFGAVVEWIKKNWDSMLLFLINPLAGIFNYCYENFEGFRNFVDNTINSVKQFFVDLWDKVVEVFEGIGNAIWIGIQLIASLFDAAFQIITLPFRFIWENCKEYVFAAWEWIKEKIDAAISAVSEKITAAKEFITEKFEAIKTAVSEKVTAIKNKVTSIFETIKNAISEKVTAIKDKITSIFETIKNTVSEKVTAIKNKIVSIFEAIKNTVFEKVTAIKNKITSIFEAIKTAVSEKITAIKNKVTSIFETIKTTISDKVTAAKNTVSNIFDSIKTKITNTVSNIKSSVTTKFNEVKNALTEPIEKAKNTISGIVDTIKGFFSGLNIQFPNIKLPHFGISPSGWEIGDLLEGSIPSLSIEWYAKAMDSPLVMSNPTIFGYNPSTGKFMGGGEAGSEVVAGTGTLMGMIAKAVADQNAAVVYWLQKVFEVMAAYFPQLLEALDMDVWLDGDLVVGGIAPKMNTALGKIKKQEDRGRKE